MKWEVEHVFTSLFWLFKDSPAPREDFTKLTGSALFAKRFCSTQWVENAPVAERLLVMWPSVVQYVAAVQSRNFLIRRTSQFATIAKCCDDLLFLVRVNVYLSLAKDFAPFLTKFQEDEPLCTSSQLTSMKKMRPSEVVVLRIDSSTLNSPYPATFIYRVHF